MRRGRCAAGRKTAGLSEPPVHGQAGSIDVLGCGHTSSLHKQTALARTLTIPRFL
jgi:hypothetical protein